MELVSGPMSGAVLGAAFERDLGQVDLEPGHHQQLDRRRDAELFGLLDGAVDGRGQRVDADRVLLQRWVQGDRPGAARFGGGVHEITWNSGSE